MVIESVSIPVTLVGFARIHDAITQKSYLQVPVFVGTIARSYSVVLSVSKTQLIALIKRQVLQTDFQTPSCDSNMAFAREL